MPKTATPATKRAAKTAAAAAPAPTRRGRKYDPAAAIRVIVADNPLTPGKKNTRRLEDLRSIATVGEANRAGIPNGYLEFYVDKGCITIE